MAKRDRVCAFCGHGAGRNSTVENFMVINKSFLPTTSQYSSGLTQYTFQQFGGFSVEQVQEEVKRGKRHVCSWCGKSKAGKSRPTSATAGCSVSRCQKTFHFLCARRYVKTSRRRTRKRRGTEVDLFRVFCSQAHKDQHEGSEKGKEEYSCSETDDEFTTASSSQLTNKLTDSESDEQDCGDIRKKTNSRDEDGDTSELAGLCQNDSSDEEDGMWESAGACSNSVRMERWRRENPAARKMRECVVVLSALEANAVRGGITATQGRHSVGASQSKVDRKRSHAEDGGPTVAKRRVLMKSSSGSSVESMKGNVKEEYDASTDVVGQRSVKGRAGKKKTSPRFVCQNGGGHDPAGSSKAGPSSAGQVEQRGKTKKPWCQQSPLSAERTGTSDSSSDFECSFSARSPLSLNVKKKPGKKVPRFRRIRLPSDSDLSSDSVKIVSTGSDFSVNTTVSTDVEASALDPDAAQPSSYAARPACARVEQLRSASDASLGRSASDASQGRSACDASLGRSDSDASLGRSACDASLGTDAVGSVSVETADNESSDLEEVELPVVAAVKSKADAKQSKAKAHQDSHGRAEHHRESRTDSGTRLSESTERRKGKPKDATVTAKDATSVKHSRAGNRDEAIPANDDEVECVTIKKEPDPSSVALDCVTIKKEPDPSSVALVDELHGESADGDPGSQEPAASEQNDDCELAVSSSQEGDSTLASCPPPTALSRSPRNTKVIHVSQDSVVQKPGPDASQQDTDLITLSSHPHTGQTRRRSGDEGKTDSTVDPGTEESQSSCSTVPLGSEESQSSCSTVPLGSEELHGCSTVPLGSEESQPGYSTVDPGTEESQSSCSTVPLSSEESHGCSTLPLGSEESQPGCSTVPLGSEESQPGCSTVPLGSEESQHGCSTVPLSSEESQPGCSTVPLGSEESQHGCSTVPLGSEESQHGCSTVPLGSEESQPGCSTVPLGLEESQHDDPCMKTKCSDQHRRPSGDEDCVLVIPADVRHFERVAFDVQRDVSEQLGLEESHVYVWTAVTPLLLPASCMLDYFSDVVSALRDQDWHRLRLLLMDAATLKTKHDKEYLPRMRRRKTLLTPAQKGAEVAKLVESIVDGLVDANTQHSGLLGMFVNKCGVNYLLLVVNRICDKGHVLRGAFRQCMKMHQWKETEVSSDASHVDRGQGGYQQECTVLRKWFTTHFRQTSKVIVLPEEELLLNKDPACPSDSHCFAQLKSRMEECAVSSSSQVGDSDLPVVVFIRRVDQDVVRFERYLQACLRKYSRDFDTRRVTCVFHVDNLSVKECPRIHLGQAQRAVKLYTAFNPSDRPVSLMVADVERSQKPSTG